MVKKRTAVGKRAGRQVGRTLDLPEERSSRIQSISLGQLPELAYLLCAGVFATLPCFEEGQPPKEETQVRDLIIPHICMACCIFQHASHTFVITSDPATPL